MKERAVLELATSWGVIRVEARNGRVTKCDLPHLRTRPRRIFRLGREKVRGTDKADREALEKAAAYLRSLFSGRPAPLPPLELPPAKPFTRRVWRRLSAIRWGERVTYGELARKVGKPHSARAVGAACRANRLPLFIPCHRVALASGALGGFSSGTPWKQLLWECERR